MVVEGLNGIGVVLTEAAVEVDTAVEAQIA